VSVKICRRSQSLRPLLFWRKHHAPAQEPSIGQIYSRSQLPFGQSKHGITSHTHVSNASSLLLLFLEYRFPPPPLSAALESLPRSEYPVEEFELFELPESQYPYPKRSETGAREAQRERQRREKLEWLLQKAEMKFSHSLQFNAVPDWSSHYIAYSNLKKL
jgi:hypothetical protein